jgi:hypothetical protein
MELPNSALLIRTPRLHLNTPISQLIKHGKLIIEIGSHPSFVTVFDFSAFLLEKSAEKQEQTGIK